MKHREYKKRSSGWMTKEEIKALGKAVEVTVEDKDPNDHSNCILYSSDGKKPLRMMD